MPGTTLTLMMAHEAGEGRLLSIQAVGRFAISVVKDTGLQVGRKPELVLIKERVKSVVGALPQIVSCSGDTTSERATESVQTSNTIIAVLEVVLILFTDTDTLLARSL